MADVITGLMGRSRFSLAADRFTTAHKGAAAFRSRSYDLAIIDQVSDVPALEAVVQLQAQSKGTAFVLLGTEPEEVIRAALSAFGISAYLCKPFGTYGFEDALHRAFGLWRPYLFNRLLDGVAPKGSKTEPEAKVQVPAASSSAGGRTPITSARGFEAPVIQVPRSDDPYTALFEVRFDTGSVGRVGVDRALLVRGDHIPHQIIKEKQQSGDLPPGGIVSVAKIVSGTWLD